MFQSAESKMMAEAGDLAGELIPAVSSMFSNLDAPPVRPKVVTFYKAVDEGISRSSNMALACNAGCNYCCHYRVMVTPVEVFAIVEHIRQLSAAQQREIELAVGQYVERVKNMGADVHLHTNVACAFLKDGICSIYPIRPLACRGHHSTDATVCRRTFEDVMSEELGPLDYNRKVVSTAMDNALIYVQISANMDDAKYEFHAALWESLTNRASAKRWRDGKVAFPSVRDKVSVKDMLANGEG